MDRIITIKGVAKISLMPDYIKFDLELISVNLDYAKALNESKVKYDSLMKSFIAIGFLEEEIKTTNFSVESVYENKPIHNQYEKIFKGYKILHQFHIFFPLDMNLLNKMINAVNQSNANPNMNIYFTIKEKEAIADALLAKAISDAKDKASFIAKNLNVILKDIKNIDYSKKNHSYFSETRYAPKMAMTMAFDSITPANIDIEDFIEITWSIE